MEIEELENLAKVLGRVIVPVGDSHRVKCGPPAPGSGLGPESVRMVAGVQWASMVNGKVVLGEVLVPVDTAGNFTAAVQQARKEVELMFEAFFPKPLVEVREPVPSKMKPPKPAARQLEASAPEKPVEAPAVLPTPAPPPEEPAKLKPMAPPPPRSATPVIQAVPKPQVPTPAPADESPAEDKEEEPERVQFTTEGAGNFEVNLPCKYANKRLRDLENPEAVRWFATHEKTNAPEFANLRLAASIWYDHLVESGQAKPKAA